MTLPIAPVSFFATDPDGKPAAGDVFRAQLDKTDVDSARGCFVVPAVIEATADASGTGILNLWPNELGTENSRYRVVAFNPDQRQKYLHVVVAVPNSACNLHEIATLANPLTL